MSLLSRLLGSGAQTPEDLTSTEQAGRAIDAADRERKAVADARSDLIEKRQLALSNDEPDAAIRKIDGEIDRLALVEDRLDALHPKLLRRMDELQSAGRRETLSHLRAAHDKIVLDLDAALAAVLPHLESYLTLAGQIDASGFSAEARAFIVRPPLIGDGVLASAQTLENWRRERERLGDMIAKTERGEALSRPIADVVPIRKATPTPAPAPAKPRRAALKEFGEPAYGYARICFLRDGCEIDGTRYLVGDELTVLADVAEQMARNGAVDILSRGELSEVAE